MNRRSDQLAILAFGAVDAADPGADDKARRAMLARTEDVPTLLLRNGLLVTAAQLDGKSSKPDYRFVRDSLRRALELPEHPSSLTASLTGRNGLDYRRLNERARAYSWWLKRAAQAKWGTIDATTT